MRLRLSKVQSTLLAMLAVGARLATKIDRPATEHLVRYRNKEYKVSHATVDSLERAGFILRLIEPDGVIPISPEWQWGMTRSGRRALERERQARQGRIHYRRLEV